MNYSKFKKCAHCGKYINSDEACDCRGAVAEAWRKYQKAFNAWWLEKMIRFWNGLSSKEGVMNNG